MVEEKERFLMHKLGEGDMAAMEVIYIRYAPQVKSFVSAILKNESDTEDLVQDIFLKVWEDRGNIAKVRSFQSYLYAMTRNLVYNRLKRRGVEERYFRSVNDKVNLVHPENRIVTKDLLRHINKELDELPEHQRTIYEMNRWNELTYDEISDRMGISPKTVQYHIGKVLARLKLILK